MDGSLESAAAVCAREPIHLSGAIQPHGWLVSCVLPDWTVRHASAHVEKLLDVSAAELIGQSLRDFIDEDVLLAVLIDAEGGDVQACIQEQFGLSGLPAVIRQCPDLARSEVGHEILAG